MARKPVTSDVAAPAADPVAPETSLPDGGAEAPAFPAPQPVPVGDPTITDETVVVTGNSVQPAPAVPPVAETISEPPAVSTQAQPQAAGFVVVTCGVSAGRRRAGRRWDAGITRVHASEFSDAQLAELQADPVLRVSIEAA